MKRRFTLALGALSLLASGFVAFGTASPAQAAGNCRVAPYSATFSQVVPVNRRLADVGKVEMMLPATYKTTTQCKDINLKNAYAQTSAKEYEVCIYFIKYGKCNTWKTVPANKWINAATNVRDNSTFKIMIRVDADRYSPKVSGALDF